MKTKFLLLLLFVTSHFIFAQSTISEWQEKLRTAKHDTTIMECYSQIADLQYVSDSMIYYVQKGLKISEKHPNHIVRSKLYNSMGRAFEVKGKRDSAIFYISKAHSIAVRLKNDNQIKYTHFNLILLNRSPAQQISDLLKMLKKYKYNTSISYDKVLLFSLNGIIADNYMRLENIDKQKVYLEKSQPFMSSLRDSIFYNMRYSRLLSTRAEHCFKTSNASCIKSVSEEYKSFLKRMEQFIEGKHKHSIMQLMPIVYGNYAEILKYERKYQESITFINKAGEGLNELDDNLTFTKYRSLGENYVKLGQLEKGISYLQKAYDYYKSSEFSGTESYILQLLAEAYSKLGQHKKAYEYLDKASKIDNNYFSKQQQQLSLEVDKQFELAEKQEEITAQEIKNKLKDERIRVERQQKNIFISLLILSLALFAFALWSYLKQRHLRGVLAKQNLQLQNQTHTLEIKTQELSEANQTKDKIFAVISHDLKSPINDLKTILLLFYSKDISTSKMKELMQSLTMKIETVQGIMTNLLQWSLLELKHQPFTSKIVPITPIVERIITQLQTAAQHKQIGIETALIPVQIQANPEDVEIIVRNILYNAIKFTPNGGNIRFVINDLGSHITVSCTDTGVGISKNILREIKHELPLPKVGTSGETGSGLGLRISQELTQRNKGTIMFNSEINKGTEVILTFPKVALNTSDLSENLIAT